MRSRPCRRTQTRAGTRRSIASRRVLISGSNLVKAKEGLRGKSEAIERIVEEFEQHILDPGLRPEFEKDVQRIQKGKFRKVRDIDDL